jgi:Ca2+-binding EF-hand superfamily protein
MKLIYKTVENAFSEMDFSGKGLVSETDFFNTLIMFKLPYTKEEIQDYFVRDNSFKQIESGCLDMSVFAKVFFPQHIMPTYVDKRNAIIQLKDG